MRRREGLIAGASGLAAMRAGAHAPEMADLLNRFFEQPGEATLDALRAEYRRLDALGQADEKHRGWLVRALLISGRFDEAEPLSRALPGWAERAWPKRQGLVDAALRRYWEVDRERWCLSERALGNADVPQVWVQSALGCPFSPGAAKAIAADRELAARMRNHSMWFAAGDDLFSSQNWAKDYPDFPLRLVTDLRGWFFKQPWSTPTFQFVREGRLVQQFSGWPRDGSHRPQLLAGLASIGLL